jgi:rod shape-determining protein MreC
MSWLSNLFPKRSRNIHFGLVVVLSLVLILGHTKVNSFVSQVLLNSLYYPFFKIRNSVEDVGVRSSDLDRLQKALVEASVKLSMCEEAQRENDRLRAALGFEYPPDYRLTPAKIVSISGFGRHLPISATINRGAKDSIFADLPIINQDGLIGRVASVTGDYATIQLLTDPSHRVAARLAGSREMGIVKYLAHEGMMLDNFPIQGNISIGDTILSSGLGGVYPAGLKIGTVVEVSRPENNPFCRVKLEPAANVHSLEEIFVLRPEQQ